MSITLLVDSDTAQALHQRARSHPVMQAIEAGHGTLFPMPAFAAGEPGARTFIVEAPLPAALAERLQRLPGVEACYVKPPDSPP
jgi:hypothetical protein